MTKKPRLGHDPFSNEPLSFIRDTVEETTRLTIEDLRTWGYLREGQLKRGHPTLKRGDEESGSLGITVNIEEKSWNPSYIKFDYLLGYDKKPIEYEHSIEAFPCHYGGHRYYFRCRHCNRRVMALYLCGGYYACRHCHRLAYEVSQRHREAYEGLFHATTLSERAEWFRKNRHPRKANRLLERAYRLEMIGVVEL